MTLIEYYLRYLQELAEGSRTPPEGVVLTEQEPLRRAASLQEQITAMGVPEFVRRCAAADGQTLPQALFDEYREEDLFQALKALSEQPPEEIAAEPEADAADAPPQIDEPDEPRNACEVLLDCCCLDEKLLYYFIDVLKRGAEEEFQRLALVTTRKAFTIELFLRWLSGKERRGTREELVCVTLMDACFDRLAAAGETELIAALISGDRKTFELFRCEAPELLHLPEATYEWFEENYLTGFYPVRYMLKFNGVAFPKEETV